jgi:Tfp pilus assembly protein FimT
MKQQSHGPNFRGFSLIEIVVIMAVIGAIALLTIPMFVTFTQAQRTQGAARQLVALLNQARQLAITRNTFFSVEVQSTPQGAQVRFCWGPVTPCPTSNVWTGPGTRADGWMTFPNRDRIPVAPSITFSSLGAATPAGTLRVQNAEGTSCLDVVVSPAGRIRIAGAACP